MTGRPARIPSFAGENGAFVEDMYARYAADPSAVDPQWAAFFAGLDADAPPDGGEAIGAGAGDRTVDVRSATLDSRRALALIRSYRVRGHLHAVLDPLDLEAPAPHSELDPESYGFGARDYDREVYVHDLLGFEKATLRTIVDALRETYCGAVGVEYMHISSPEEKGWIQDRIEAIHNRTEFTDRGKLTILERLTEAEGFEQFLHVKYPGTKRFGLDGGEALIPALEQILKRGSQLGIEEVVLGMAHRGRLNVLAHVLNKPYAAIFSEFRGAHYGVGEVQGSGDVKYHLGTSADREFDDVRVHLSLSANPSHLEAVDPVVVGKVRAKQRQRGDAGRRRVMGLLMHGDAAFSGQGIVAETFGLSDIEGYRTGGTIHVVVNNQIGFTTSPGATRASRYPTDLAKAAEAPIFHVNGDDVEAVVHVARIATEFRQTFRKDVVIDIWCYRRFGHNEGDEPSFTQPRMYRAIAGHPTVRELYARRLVDEGITTPAGAEEISARFRDRLERGFEAADGYRPNKADWLEGSWSGMTAAPAAEERRGKTAVTLKTLREVGEALTRAPDGFRINPKLDRVLRQRREMLDSGEGIDWATAESLAFGALLCEGVMVRISGQDSVRGTFSQRHLAFTDQETEARHVPLAQLPGGEARFVARDSPLAEASVLGFEYGMSLADPNMLVIWEAQFGDFANGAQLIVDQFVSSGESKWLRMSGLVMLLPHGYEGQGPEHSSARLERYLQLCAEDNIQVANITTPANYFHALRRQIHRKFRKPLVVMTPKSLLRHRQCVSSLSDMAGGSSFRRVLPESRTLAPDGEIRRVVLCSGKVYYDLAGERNRRGADDVALLRLEQLYPFPAVSLAKELARYPRAEVVWCQEEPRNMGAWSFADRRIEEVLAKLGGPSRRPRYVGRDEAASPATGLHARHVRQQAKLVEDALAPA